MRCSRRSVIRDAKARRAVVVLAIALAVASAPLCLVRVARVWSVPGPGGGIDAHRLMIEHGTLMYASASAAILPADTGLGPGPAMGASPAPHDPVLNWQFDPGLSFEYSLTHLRTPGPGGGVVVSDSRVIPVAGPLLIVAVGAVLLVVPVIRVPDGECVCGYVIEGLKGDRCPECGERLGVRASA